jgi:aminocarboxymuconate-semialdehyde decarboxylase
MSASASLTSIVRTIDAFPHVLPKPYFDRMMRVSSPRLASIQQRMADIPALYDLDVRFRVMDEFGDYRQILTLASPPIEALGEPTLARDLATLANDSMADLVAKHPDRFAGFAASLAMNDDPDAIVTEIDRAIGTLGALGIQVFTSANGVPLDDPRFEPLFARMAALDRAIWVHPTRAASTPDYPGETASKFELWWAFGWPYETAIFMSRLVFSGHLDRHPGLRILTHHGGGLVPHLSGRIDHGLDQLGARTPGGDIAAVREKLARRPSETFRMFYGDTALFGAAHALRCSIDYFGVDHIIFGTDMPFDEEGGPLFIRHGIADLAALELSAADRAAIHEGNARRVFRLP